MNCIICICIEDIINRNYENSGDLGNYGATCEGDPPLCCETLTLTGNDMYQIQKNDIIGVCMRDAGKYDPLYSLDEDAPGHTVYQYPSTDDCNKAGDIENFDLGDLDQSPKHDFGLHACLPASNWYDHNRYSHTHDIMNINMLSAFTIN